MRNASIRVRLTACYSAVLLLALGLFGFGTWFALKQRLIAGVDARLGQRMEGLRRAVAAESEIHARDQFQQELAEFARDVPDGTMILLRDDADKLFLPFQLREIVGLDLTSPRTIASHRAPFRALTGRIPCSGDTYEVLMVSPLDEVTQVMLDFRRLLLLMVPAVLAVACTGGFWLSSRALRPVDEITGVARLISVQNLSQRLPVPRTGDEIQRMSETWNQVLERLDIAVNRIRQFTADASHELRTPLALVRATAELALRRERSPEEYRASLRTIESGAEHMTELTEALLTVARADSGGLEMALAPTDLSGLVNSVVSQNQAASAEKGICLTAGANAQPVFASANNATLRRLLLILIDNSLKYTPAGGRVNVSADLQDGAAVLSVEDTGEGITPEDLPHIFERFYRGDPARGSGSGFGLGLSIAQAIAQAHGARLIVESSPGAGARFSLRW